MHLGLMVGTKMKRTIMRIRTYTELIRIEDFVERYEYLRLRGEVGVATFGWERWLNQELYKSSRWRRVRDKVIIRDMGCDLAHPDFQIGDRIIIHHMNPLTPEDIEDDVDEIYEPEFLICTSHMTHNAIHYGDQKLLPQLPVERFPGDMCPWK